jgi:hypothetical protein
MCGTVTREWWIGGSDPPGGRHMESRTSPGKGGSVQPISGCPGGVSCRFAWECRHVEAVEGDTLVASVWLPPALSFVECPRLPCPLLGLQHHHFLSLVVRQELNRCTSGSAGVAGLSPCPTCLHDTCLEPTHVAVNGFPVDVMPSLHTVVGSRTSWVNCHLLCLLNRFALLSRERRPGGSLRAFA